MVQFRGLIEDALLLSKKPGTALVLSHIEGMPKVGMQVSVSGKFAEIKELGRNSTDGQPVSTRSCLTGQPCEPYGSILVEWKEDAVALNDLHLLWVTEEDVS